MSDNLVKRLRQSWDADRSIISQTDLWMTERVAAADRIEELEAKLAEAVGLLEAWINVATHCTIEEGVCCCGDSMDTHAEPMDCGHSPVDHGAYIVESLVEETNATLKELTGGKDE